MQKNDVFQYDHHLITDKMILIFEKYITDNGINIVDMPIDKFRIFIYWAGVGI